MVVYEKARLSQGMDHVGKEMHYHLLILCSSEWVPRGRVDSSAEGSEARIPTYTSIICVGSRCTGHM